MVVMFAQQSPTTKDQFENSRASKIPSRILYLCEYEKIVF